ncbi:peptide-methionine (S)-S-oxide reductase MsrA [Lacticaseibacillus kribbianus]|uniref:peptide-methionine (S)-S-oxide reductase MsrA n=1 Tax=Lacticaseibacillus kribbianus TaxID=2926292 RepID=UPI001CD23560|nr:peptide-methionine (S)-S-oxide reductase MsrA [Lacticaseibacillus kribbianus]
MLATIINALLDPGTRDFERQHLLSAKRALEAGQRERAVLGQLEAALRPLAVRDNLTPQVAALYQTLTGGAVVDEPVAGPVALDDAYAVFGGGCFWCLVQPFESRPGVRAAVSGYTGGHVPHPTEDQVASGTTGHREAVEIRFAPRELSYAALVDQYLALIDPLDGAGQYLDRGDRYTPAIFYQDDRQRDVAQAKLAALSQRLGRPVAVALRPAAPFWPAPAWHQDFYRKQPRRYRAVLAARRRLQRYKRIAAWLGHPTW